VAARHRCEAASMPKRWTRHPVCSNEVTQWYKGKRMLHRAEFCNPSKGNVWRKAEMPQWLLQKKGINIKAGGSLSPKQ